MKQRYYITASVPYENKRELPFSKFPRKNTHMTLAYLGFRRPEEEPDMMRILEHIVREHKDTKLEHKGYARFGKYNSTQVAEFVPSSRILDLQKNITTVFGVENKHKGFRPHLTMAYADPLVRFNKKQLDDIPVKSVSLYRMGTGPYGNARLSTVKLQKRNLLDKVHDWIIP